MFHACSVWVVEHLGVFKLRFRDESDDGRDCEVCTYYMCFTVTEQICIFGNSLALLMNGNVAGALEEFAKLKKSRSISNRSVFKILKSVPVQTQ